MCLYVLFLRHLLLLLSHMVTERPFSLLPSIPLWGNTMVFLLWQIMDHFEGFAYPGHPHRNVGWVRFIFTVALVEDKRDIQPWPGGGCRWRSPDWMEDAGTRSSVWFLQSCRDSAAAVTLLLSLAWHAPCPPLPAPLQCPQADWGLSNRPSVHKHLDAYQVRSEVVRGREHQLCLVPESLYCAYGVTVVDTE